MEARSGAGVVEATLRDGSGERPGAAPHPGGERGVFLSTLRASRRDYRAVIAVMALSAVIFLAFAPFAKMQLPQIWGFLPVYQSALVVTDLITALLLFGQFAILRSRALVALACGYLFSAFMAIAHALSFPGLFAEGGLLDSGPQTTAWLYFLWHGGLPLFVIAYALLKDEPAADRPAGNPAAAILASIVAVGALAVGLVILTTEGHDTLPVLMQGNMDDSGKMRVATITWMLSFVALPILWWRRPHSVLDVWLLATMGVWIFDTALASVLNHGRFDLGWYAGRTYGLLASSFVMMVLLIENAMLYARLIEAHENERREHQRAEEKSRQLAAANRDLEAFSYSVSHDLRAPLRSIDGFSQVLQEEYSGVMDNAGRAYMDRIRRAAQRMATLIDDMLNLSKVSRSELKRMNVDLTAIVREIADTLTERAPERTAAIAIGEGIGVRGDPGLLRIALENLLNNSWKFTAGKPQAQIEFGQCELNGETVCFVRDNGAGFDMAYAGKLFGAFQRLHANEEFPGTGIGLAIVQRVLSKHGGRIWAEAETGKGATFYFTLSQAAEDSAALAAKAA